MTASGPASTTPDHTDQNARQSGTGAYSRPSGAGTRLATAQGPPASADTPVAELVQRASAQITQLVRDELTMARTEIAVKGNERESAQGCSAAAPYSVCTPGPHWSPQSYWP